MVHKYGGILLSLKQNGIMPFAAAWTDPEITMLTEVSHVTKTV